jgi:dipeptide transport system permease protein
VIFKFFVQRIWQSIPTLFGVTVIAFALIRLIPGDPVLMMLGERSASPELVQELRANLGLDQPLVSQYFSFISGALRGNLGDSLISKRSVWSEFVERFPATMELSLLALLWAIALGIPMGVLAAIKRRKFWDYFLMSISLIGYSMPIFWWGLMLILIFSVGLNWTPVSGRLGAAFDFEPWSGFYLIDVWVRGAGWPAFVSVVQHLFLPALVLGTIPVAAIARMTRSSLLEILREDFVRTARAKGLPSLVVVFKHALKPALMPVVTVIGLMMGTLLTGAVLTETLFSWPGVGRWLVSSVLARDYPVLQGGVLLLSAMIVIVNAAVDALYLWLNPRLRGSL